MTDILIVGAGVAGMAAAEHLAGAGYAPRLVDKAARPGGRCATRRVAQATDADWFDYGAQYFTARHEDFKALTDADLALGRLSDWRPAIATAERIGGTWLLAPSPDERQRLIGPGGLNAWVRDRLAARDVTVAGNRQVNAVDRTDDGWMITYDDGKAEPARAVLLTPPAPQARSILGDRAASINVLANAGTALSACHSIVIEAPAISDAQAIFFKSGRVSWAADNTHKANRARDRHLWTLHADAAYSDQYVDTETADLAQTLIADFAGATAQSIDEMRLVRAHRWRYARPGPGAPDEDSICWVDTSERLAIAGDWLAGGRVEGAWLSGREAARRLASALGTG